MGAAWPSFETKGNHENTKARNLDRGHRDDFISLAAQFVLGMRRGQPMHPLWCHASDATVTADVAEDSLRCGRLHPCQGCQSMKLLTTMRRASSFCFPLS